MLQPKSAVAISQWLMRRGVGLHFFQALASLHRQKAGRAARERPSQTHRSCRSLSSAYRGLQRKLSENGVDFSNPSFLSTG